MVVVVVIIIVWALKIRNIHASVCMTEQQGNDEDDNDHDVSNTNIYRYKKYYNYLVFFSFGRNQKCTSNSVVYATYTRFFLLFQR